jgi:hypothetical protein
VLHRGLHLLSLFCCVIVATSFVLFGHDQVAGASLHQTELLGSGTPVAATTPARRTVGEPRAFIDGVSRNLTSPFDSIVHSNNPWVDHGVPAALALVVYGFGLGFVARWANPETYKARTAS